jgi:hypothetical protein
MFLSKNRLLILDTGIACAPNVVLFPNKQGITGNNRGRRTASSVSSLGRLVACQNRGDRWDRNGHASAARAVATVRRGTARGRRLGIRSVGRKSAKRFLHDSAEASAREHGSVIPHFDQPHDDQNPQLLLIEGRPFQPIAFNIS